MHRTALRAGVLVYIAVADRKLAVIGDAGIHERVGQAYWDGIVGRVLAFLRDGAPARGPRGRRRGDRRRPSRSISPAIATTATSCPTA